MYFLVKYVLYERHFPEKCTHIRKQDVSQNVGQLVLVESTLSTEKMVDVVLLIPAKGQIYEESSV